jgi:hypothetical protein
VLWVTPVILAIQEAQIRRIAVQNQPRQRVLEILSQKYPTRNTHKKTLAEWLKWQCLPSKHKALSSNSSTEKKKILLALEV